MDSTNKILSARTVAYVFIFATGTFLIFKTKEAAIIGGFLGLFISFIWGN